MIIESESSGGGGLARVLGGEVRLGWWCNCASSDCSNGKFCTDISIV